MGIEHFYISYFWDFSRNKGKLFSISALTFLTFPNPLKLSNFWWIPESSQTVEFYAALYIYFSFKRCTRKQRIQHGAVHDTYCYSYLHIMWLEFRFLFRHSGKLLLNFFTCIIILLFYCIKIWIDHFKKIFYFRRASAFSSGYTVRMPILNLFSLHMRGQIGWHEHNTAQSGSLFSGTVVNTYLVTKGLHTMSADHFPRVCWSMWAEARMAVGICWLQWSAVRYRQRLLDFGEACSSFDFT